MALVSERLRVSVRWALIVIAVLLQVAQLRMGPTVTLPALAAALALPAALLQGLGLVGQGRRPMLGALAISVGYLTQVLAVGVVPAYVGWLAIALSPGLEPQPNRRSSVVALATTSTGLAVGVVAAGVVHGDRGGTVPTLLLIEAVVLLGTGLSRTRNARAQALALAAQNARARQLAEERLRIARDLHDLVGHGLSTIAVQSSTARMALDAGSLADARAAVAAVESGSRDALREMRQLLDLLRQERGDGDDQTAPAPGIRDLPDLLERVRSAGISVVSDGDLVAPDDVPADIQLAAFRIVQESLTNIIRHAPESSARVAIAIEGGSLHVEVLDTGALQTSYSDAAVPTPPGSGMGVLGMRERAESLGGGLEAGPTSTGDGWRVSASLPLPNR